MEMLSIVRSDGTFKHVNPAWTTVLGWAEDELVDTLYMQFVHPADHAATIREAERIAQGAPTIDFENRYRAKDGSYRWLSWHVTPAADGRLLYCATRDVTEARHSKDEAVRANRAKSDFLSRMSHELRTPLNAILGFAQLFDRDRMSDGDRENIRQILDGGRHLLDLINEVIDISRVESGTLALSNEPVDVYDAAVSAVALIRPLAAAQGIVVTVTPLPQPGLAVVADRQRLRQVLLNLLSNAVKYNRVNGTIQVAVERGAPGRIRVCVRDTGPGISPQLLALLFHPFERLGADKTAVEGTGLGLALSKALCEAMGGTLEVSSVVDHGSTFSVELAETTLAAPLDMQGLASPVPAPPQPAAESGLVIYIEDNFANVRLMERILLRRPGLTLMHAVDGRSGIALVREHAPDLVLLDLQLPEMSGDEVLRELWKDPDTRRIPIVVLTADATRGLPQRLMSAGARACLTKPLDVQQVLRTLDELIGAAND